MCSLSDLFGPKILDWIKYFDLTIRHLSLYLDMNRNQAIRGKNPANPRGKVPVRGKQPTFATNNASPFGQITMLGALSAMNSLIEDYSSMQGPMRTDNPQQILSIIDKGLLSNDMSTIDSYCKFHKNLIPSLINTSNTYSILHKACKLGKSQAVEYFLQYGGNPNLKNKSNRTPLHKSYGSTQVVEVLVKYGADLNAQDNKGFTPVHRAIIKKSWEVAKAMIKLGGSLRTTDNTHKMPIDYCEDKQILRQLEALFTWSKVKPAIFVYKFSHLSRLKEPLLREILSYL